MSANRGSLPILVLELLAATSCEQKVDLPDPKAPANTKII
jgi:hypothetical protein